MGRTRGSLLEGWLLLVRGLLLLERHAIALPVRSSIVRVRGVGLSGVRLAERLCPPLAHAEPDPENDQGDTDCDSYSDSNALEKERKLSANNVRFEYVVRRPRGGVERLCCAECEDSRFRKRSLRSCYLRKREGTQLWRWVIRTRWLAITRAGGTASGYSQPNWAWAGDAASSTRRTGAAVESILRSWKEEEGNELSPKLRWANFELRRHQALDHRLFVGRCLVQTE